MTFLFGFVLIWEGLVVVVVGSGWPAADGLRSAADRHAYLFKSFSMSMILLNIRTIMVIRHVGNSTKKRPLKHVQRPLKNIDKVKGTTHKRQLRRKKKHDKSNRKKC